MSDQLSTLRKMTVVVADTGELESIKRFTPEDATTNPTLILKAVESTLYDHLIKDAFVYGERSSEANRWGATVDFLAVGIGKEILKVVPGRISTEVDARLSFDTSKTLERARHLIKLYQQAGISKERVLIKIAATYEGIKAAEALEKEGVNTNVTLLFSLVQAQAAAQAGAYLVSPFVGRILDWYKANQPNEDFEGANDPGVKSVTQIYQYYKQNDFSTVVMGASFRSLEEIRQLAGCDRLTIGPGLLEGLEADSNPLPQKLSPTMTGPDMPKREIDEKIFRWELNENPMATEKLSEGIRKFAADTRTLETYLQNWKG